LRIANDAFGEGLNARGAAVDLLAHLALEMRDGGRLARAEPAEFTCRAASRQDDSKRSCGADES
jgi:hypothetical protein